MKAATAKLGPLWGEHQSKLKVVLFYGEDEFYVDGAVRLFCEKIAPSLPKPLTTQMLGGADFSLQSLLSMQDFFNPTGTYILKGATDSLAKELTAHAAEGSELVIVTASALTPRSKLRHLAETHANILSIPCYSGDALVLNFVLAAAFQDRSTRFSSQAQRLFLSKLAQTPFMIPKEIEKLCLYVGDREITEEDVDVCTGDMGEQEIFTLVQQFFNKSPETLAVFLEEKLTQLGGGVLLVRSLSYHAQRLLQAHIYRSEGQSLEQVFEMLTPPVFWKDRPTFQKQLTLWSPSKLLNFLDQLLSWEALFKQGGASGEIILQKELAVLLK